MSYFIFLDTNIIFNDFFFKSAELKAILNSQNIILLSYVLQNLITKKLLKNIEIILDL